MNMKMIQFSGLFDFSGPGCSSVGAGAFVEHGPFRPKGNVLLRNEYSWNKGKAVSQKSST